MKIFIPILIFTVAISAVSIGWWVDHRNLDNEIERLRITPDAIEFTDLLDAYDLGREKHNQWSPSTFLGNGTSHYEELLNLTDLKGPIEKTKRGWSQSMLRIPTPSTIDTILTLLNDEIPEHKLHALKLTALYSEAFESRIVYYYQDPHEHFVYFRAALTNHIFASLHDPNPEIRGVAALAVAYTAPRKVAIEKLMVAWKNETDDDAKWRISWALTEQLEKRNRITM